MEVQKEVVNDDGYLSAVGFLHQSCVIRLCSHLSDWTFKESIPT